MKRLNEFIDTSYDIKINNICSDSRNVKHGDLFIAINGYNVDHFDYIDEAIDNGAVCVIVDRDYKNNAVCVIKVDDINEVYYNICSRFYNKSGWDFTLIGVTGTDGKTTTATMIHDLINPLEKCAYIGTNGALIGEVNFRTNNTTPCLEELYYFLNFSNESECKYVVIEVSSEALLHDRVKDLDFDIAIFTNITEDHLNIHKNIDNYIQCKYKLIDLVKNDGKIIYNGDDLNLETIVNYGNYKMYSVGIKNDNFCQIKNVKTCRSYSLFDMNYNNKIKHCYCPFIGVYNVYNLTMGLLCCYFLGLDVEINNIKPVLGRCEILDFKTDYTIILDYAHTTNGIRTILESVDTYARIICVSGAAGGREIEKRPVIGKLLLEKCDFVIFTMDDPRYEDVNDIIDQMIGKTNLNNYIRIVDRKQAIKYALDMADDNDLVLILGKGRDNYMAVDDKKLIYCDYDVIRDYFN